MFLEIFSLYIQGLLLSIISVFLVGIFWNFWRARRKYDKTAKERQAFLYDVLMMSIMTIPVLSFTFMAILLMFKA
ncbi:hypothetical protein Si034_00809 [Streptococcus infantarius subsp. infantarius]|nr:hypothetical protein [Streptococcus infantarius subsp. infantarius]MCO4637883.1 hypothetical protein [Streptococcus infantarius subsp. infantarius]MCO4642204.1 hypothetical protein [Streptococcus infantarius subsp. infantarius]MCO4643836.1 hypothetical protein [Streptococcus infantarius subsp. infantarius]MCO4651556.1 hypothetical protein [Streptococcus infantarius subsp. infantarius]